MKYKIRTRLNAAHPEGKKIQYARPVNPGKVTLQDFAMRIAGRSSLTRGDIESVLTNFAEQLPAFLKLGMSVGLGALGTVRLSIHSEGMEEGAPFTASHIRGVRVVFRPGVELKEALRHISFEEEES
ncbi:MAG: DNA-binding protein [Tannerellaceae bacterium]|jgi:predicted histone-like DNA-binding protein|nr:DNA-binding protein [Tannerellaceae bacterium]